jgi:transcription antitermination factor NusG
MGQWFVLPVLSQRELTVEKRIRALGYAAMAPWDEGQRRIRGLYRPWRFPLYTGYVFVSLSDAAAGWQHLSGTLNSLERRLVFPLLAEGDAPAVLRPSDVQYLQSIADGGYVRSLVVGDTVLVPDGYFQGQRSTITKIRNSKKRGNRATVKVKGEKNDVLLDFPLAILSKV